MPRNQRGSHGSPLLNMRRKSVVRPVRADTQVKAVRVQRDGTSPVTNREQAAQARVVQVLVARTQIDPRALAEAVVDVLVAVPVDRVVAQGDSRVVVQVASRPGNPDLEQAESQGEAVLRARGKRCSSTKGPENRRVIHWGIHSLAPPQ